MKTRAFGVTHFVSWSPNVPKKQIWNWTLISFGWMLCQNPRLQQPGSVLCFCWMSVTDLFCNIKIFNLLKFGIKFSKLNTDVFVGDYHSLLVLEFKFSFIIAGFTLPTHFCKLFLGFEAALHGGLLRLLFAHLKHHCWPPSPTASALTACCHHQLQLLSPLSAMTSYTFSLLLITAPASAATHHCNGEDGPHADSESKHVVFFTIAYLLFTHCMLGILSLQMQICVSLCFIKDMNLHHYYCLLILKDWFNVDSIQTLTLSLQDQQIQKQIWFPSKWQCRLVSLLLISGNESSMLYRAPENFTSKSGLGVIHLNVRS